MVKTSIVQRDGQWVVMWQTPSMPAPAFWYYDTRQEAQAVVERLTKKEGNLVNLTVQFYGNGKKLSFDVECEPYTAITLSEEVRDAVANLGLTHCVVLGRKYGRPRKHGWRATVEVKPISCALGLTLPISTVQWATLMGEEIQTGHIAYSK